MMAAWGSSRPEVASFLLARGADPTLKDSEGKTALDLAEENGTPAVGEIVKFLQNAR